MKQLATKRDGPGQLRLAAIHAVQQKLTNSGSAAKVDAKNNDYGWFVRVVAPKRLRYGKKFQHISDLVWSELPVTEIVAGNFRTDCMWFQPFMNLI